MFHIGCSNRIFSQVDAIAMGTLLLYTLAMSKDLTPSVAFSMWVVLSVLHGKIFRFPVAARETSESLVSINRISSLINQNISSGYCKLVGDSLCIKDLHVGWGAVEEARQPFELRVPEMEIRPGALLGLCGTVASGKTSLLHAILGHFCKLLLLGR